MGTNITGDIVPLIKYCQYTKKKMGNQLKVFPWDVPDDKTDDGLHFLKISEAYTISLRGISFYESLRNLRILPRMTQSVSFGIFNRQTFLEFTIK
jgi:hypothetical protein